MKSEDFSLHSVRLGHTAAREVMILAVLHNRVQSFPTHPWEINAVPLCGYDRSAMLNKLFKAEPVVTISIAQYHI
jgi:hypothetical protein